MILRLTQEEKDRIRVKMDEAGIRNMSAYVRKMVLDGICVKLDLEDVREMSVLLRRCSNNLNQYAKRANETGSIYAADISAFPPVPSAAGKHPLIQWDGVLSLSPT